MFVVLFEFCLWVGVSVSYRYLLVGYNGTIYSLCL